MKKISCFGALQASALHHRDILPEELRFINRYVRSLCTQRNAFLIGWFIATIGIFGVYMSSQNWFLILTYLCMAIFIISIIMHYNYIRVLQYKEKIINKIQASQRKYNENLT